MRSMIDRVLDRFRHLRATRLTWQLLLIGLDAAGILLATVVTYLARFELRIPHAYGRYLLLAFATSVVVYVAAAALFGLYRVVLRYVGIDTMLRCGGAVLCAAAALTLADIAVGLLQGGQRAVPLGVVLIQAVFVFMVLAGIRLSVRAAHYVRATGRHGGLRTLIIGAGSAGSLLLRDIEARPGLGLQVVGFLDDNEHIRGSRLGGVRVLGSLDDLEDVVADCDVQQLFVALPSAPDEVLRALLNRAATLGLSTRIMPKLVIETGEVRAADLRTVDVEDLLGRELTPIDSEQVAATIAGKCVAVTGAAGSIGSELCRQIMKLHPARLVLLEIDESRLYELFFELEAIEPGVAQMCLVDIRDRRKLLRVFAETAPSVVLHAAAYKQVPLMEDEPIEAVRSNVVGTAHVMEAAARVGTERFVLISTDKAVAPVNVMGKTKQLAERLMLAFVRTTAQDRKWAEASLPADEQASVVQRSHPDMICVAVRFGNVLGSRGSVVPIFEGQLLRGGPVTVTDAEATRFFMAIPEAARLVLQAQAIGDEGDIFVLEMGEPHCILDLAHKMIALSGVPADIEIVGLRPGEKLHESLTSEGEELEPTSAARILRVAHLCETPLDARTYERLVSALEAGTLTRDDIMLL
ncbi:MAG: polysaccharide biosynthesis protein [Actinomycetia bacterium]|nr:polysaccharide biosynthesis protein [Actinomycetes bacterium]